VTLAAWRRLARWDARQAPPELTAGVDEAGRGPLAGPVVAAAEVLRPRADLAGRDDAKKHPPEQRLAAHVRVLEQARAFAWSVVGQRAIDRINIRGASLLAMRRAVERLPLRPQLVLVDGADRVPGLSCEQRVVVGGDAKSLCIAAASVLAKVVRDRVMERLDAVYPLYGFARHKGYATPEHLEALAAHGPCPLHRYSFAPVCTLSLALE
jgi:ribonuclease HII